MSRTPLLLAAVLLLCGGVIAQQKDFRRATDDLIALEGKTPPAIEADNWINTEGKALDLASLQGKVVVIDFWGTWWGPCRKSAPTLNELYGRYKDQGLVLIGLHTTMGGEKMESFATKAGLTYPMAVDVKEKTTTAYDIAGYPTVVLVDRSGKVRVADIAKSDLERAVKTLIAEKAPRAAASHAPFARERKDATREAKDALEGKAPPALQVEGWMNTDGKALDLASLEGKVVVLDFWGTWWGPCRSAIPHLNELHARYKDQGLVLIGVHTASGSEKMEAFAKEEGITYPIAIDTEGKTVEAFAVDSFPAYYVIDRKGKVRVADLANKELDRAIKTLLAEPAPKDR